MSTLLLAALYIASALMYMLNGDLARQLITALGYPAYLVELLSAAKLLGVAAIVLRVHVGLSDLAYAGMLYHLLLAGSAHINAGDGKFWPALAGIAIVIVSFATQNAARANPSPYAPQGADGGTPRYA